MELLRRAEGAAARDDDLGAGQLGPLGLARARRRRSWRGPCRRPPETASIVPEPPSRRRLLEGGAAHGDHLLGVGRFHRGDRVAGVDRPGEGVLALDREDLGDLHDVEQGGDARRDVLAGGGRRRDEGVVVGHQLRGERRDILGQLVGVGRVVGDMDLADAGDLRGGLGDRRRRPGRRRADGPRPASTAAVTAASVASFTWPPSCSTENQRLHATTPRVFSLPISSSTEPTLTPAWRFGGSLDLERRQPRRGVDAVIGRASSGASGLDLAFMMLGRRA